MTAHAVRRRAWRASHRSRWPVAALLVLAPVCAEYVSAYDDTTGDPLALLGGLLILIPLYGCPALAIREVARRAALGWPGILLLAAVFGIVEAGMVDQSLFRDTYRDIPEWRDGLEPTYVAPLGFGALYAFIFLGGHVAWSISAPIALAEGLCPGRADARWVGRRGLAVALVLYGLASVLIVVDQLDQEGPGARPGELAGCAVVAAALIGLAFAQRAWRRPRAPGRPVPPAVAVFAGTVALAAAVEILPGTWAGVGVGLAVSGLAVAVVAWFARSPRWRRLHAVALAAGALTANAVLAFTYFPLLGDVPAERKYTHNAVMLLVVLGVAAACARRADGDGTS